MTVPRDAPARQRWGRWFADTLSKRLLLLLWAALVGSHLLAYAVVSAVHFPSSAGPGHLPTFPSLPPTPGVPDPRAPQGPLHAERGLGPPAPPPPKPSPADGGHALPWTVLVLDYGVRLAVMALAAWFGSRWLAAPMRQLVAASRSLGGSIGGEAVLPVLDERSGTREVRETARVFNEMARQLFGQFRSRSLMVAALSHDLRTPLTRVRMRLETTQASDDPAARQRNIADIREMNALIDNVLEVFRLDGPGQAERAQDTDVGALVHAIVDDLVEQRQPVCFEGDAEAVVWTQPMALRRVVTNLIGNALRYGERAEVRVAAGEGEVRIVVDDAGPGIAAQELEAVFQPFYRVEASRNRHTGGAGLGLYIARDLTRRLGGELTLCNRAEGGLRAEVVLPITDRI